MYPKIVRERLVINPLSGPKVRGKNQSGVRNCPKSYLRIFSCRNNIRTKYFLSSKNDDIFDYRYRLETGHGNIKTEDNLKLSIPSKAILSRINFNLVIK